MALTADQLNTIYQNVLFRNVDQGGIQFFANRTDISDAQVRQQIELSSEASSFVSPIVRLYQEVLGRVPDQGGLRFFQGQLRAGASLSSVAQQLISSQEFTTKTAGTGIVDSSDFSNTNQLVSDAFQSILGRTPATSELAFFQGQSPAQILAGVAGSAEATQTNVAGVVSFLDSVAQGTYPTGSLTNQTGGTGGQNVGQTFTLTANIDALTGTGNNDTFIGDANTVTAADQINGGAGTDTLQLFGTATLPTVTNVERIVFTNPGGVITPNLSNINGLTEVVLTGATTASTITTAAGVKTTIDASGTTAAPIAQLTVSTADTATAETVGLSNGSNITALTVNGAAVTALTLDSSGSSANVIGTLNGSAGATALANSTLNITGSQKLTITNALDTDFTTVNASTNTGGVSVTFGANTVTATGGSGADKFAFGANLTTADTVVGGAGTDTISVAGADYSTVVANGTLAALNSKVTGVETLEFTGANAATISGTTFTNTEITKILFNTTDAAGTDIVNSAGSARTYAVGELNDAGGALTLNGTAGVTSFNVSLEGITGNGGNVGALNAAFTNNTAAQVGTGTINLASIGTNDAANVNSTGVITGTSNGGALTSTNVVVTGSHDLTIGGLGTAGTINASAFTGKLVATGSGAQDTIIGGSGADTINASTGGDTYTGNAGADTFVFTNINQASSSVLTTISDFTSGSDKLNVSAISTAAGSFNPTAVNVTAAPDFAGALNAAAAGNGGAAGLVTYFQQGGNTYVVVDNGAGNTFDATTDAVIKLTGLVTLTANDVVA